MDVTQLLTDLASDLLEYNKYEVTAGSYLYRQAFRAALRVNNKYPWTHQITSTTITATDGNKGPYDLPSDFKGMIREERLSPIFTYDKQGVPIIPDGDYQKMYFVYWKRVDNKLYFMLDPPAGSYTLFYRKKLTALTELSDWPQEFEPAVAQFAMYYALKNSKDTKADALDALELGRQERRQIWNSERKGHSLQDTIQPRDINGDEYGIYDGAGYWWW